MPQLQPIFANDAAERRAILAGQSATKFLARSRFAIGNRKIRLIGSCPLDRTLFVKSTSGSAGEAGPLQVATQHQTAQMIAAKPKIETQIAMIRSVLF